MSVTIANASTVKQYSSRLGVSVHAVLGFIANGDLAAIDVSAKPGVGRPTWRIPESAIVDFSLKRSSKKPAKQLRRRRKKKDPDFVNYF